MAWERPEPRVNGMNEESPMTRGRDLKDTGIEKVVISTAGSEESILSLLCLGKANNLRIHHK